MKLTPTEKQIAGIFTKGRSTKNFEEMRAQLRVLKEASIQSKSVLRGTNEEQHQFELLEEA